jgi:hypothetical protein
MESISFNARGRLARPFGERLSAVATGKQYHGFRCSVGRIIESHNASDKEVVTEIHFPAEKLLLKPQNACKNSSKSWFTQKAPASSRYRMPD